MRIIDYPRRALSDTFGWFFWCRYEAWVIYNFLSLCLSWVGGPGEVVTSLTGKILQPSWHLMTCCLPPIPLDGSVSYDDSVLGMRMSTAMLVYLCLKTCSIFDF